MRCALLLSLIAAARAFAPPSILRASVVVKNEADAASTVPESYEKISIARRAVMPRALRRASTLSLRTKTPRRRRSIAYNPCLRHPLTTEIGLGKNVPASIFDDSFTLLQLVQVAKTCPRRFLTTISQIWSSFRLQKRARVDV